MRQRIDKRWNSGEGFSLLEVLVALSILALSLGSLTQIFATGYDGTVNAGRYTKAIAVAERVLASAGTERPLEEGGISGDDTEPYAWTLTITQVPNDAENPTHRMYDIAVSVSWRDIGRDRTVSLRTLRLGGLE